MGPTSREVPAAMHAALERCSGQSPQLHDRLQRGRVDRLVDKDAADVVRLMQSTRVTDVAATMRQLMTDARAGAVTTSALGYLDEAFGRRGRPGTVMAARALGLALTPEAIEALCVA